MNKNIIIFTNVALSFVYKLFSICASLTFSLLAYKYGDSINVTNLVLLISISTIIATIYRMGIDDIVLISVTSKKIDDSVNYIYSFLKFILRNFILSVPIFICLALYFNDYFYVSLPLFSLSLCLNFIYSAMLVGMDKGNVALIIRGGLSYFLCIPFIFISIIFDYDILLLCSIFSIVVNLIICIYIYIKFSLSRYFLKIEKPILIKVSYEVFLYSVSSNIWMNLFVFVGWSSGSEQIPLYNLIQRLINVSSVFSQVVIFKYNFVIAYFNDKITTIMCAILSLLSLLSLLVLNNTILLYISFLLLIVINAVISMSKYHSLKNDRFIHLALLNMLMSIVCFYFVYFFSSKLEATISIFCVSQSFIWFLGIYNVKERSELC